MIAKILAEYFANVSILTHLNSSEITSLQKKFKKIKFLNIPNNQKE